MDNVEHPVHNSRPIPCAPVPGDPIPDAPAPSPPVPGVAVPGNAVSGSLTQRLLEDLPFVAMLAMALAGVVLRLPVVYWVILTPVFGIISITEGWKHFSNRSERLDLICRLALDWCAVLLAIYLLYNSGVQGVLNANATSLAMMTLLALGTFVAGVQAKVWEICTIGGILFAAVPALGWLDQSPLLLTVAAFVTIALTGAAWWLTRRPRSVTGPGSPSPSP